MMKRGLMPAVLAGLLLSPLGADAQSAQGSIAMIDAKRMEIRHHTEKMQAIKDSAELQRETQKHFRMVEELMGMMIAQQRQSIPAGMSAPSAAMPMEGEMAMPAAGSGGQPGMMDDDAMEMPMGSPSGGTPAGGMAGGMEGEMAMPAPPPGGQPGMMDDDAMEMPAAAPPSGGMGAGGMGGGMMSGMHGEHGMGMGATGGGAPMAGAADAAQRIAEREALLAEVTRHSQYIESLTDANARSRELVRHQKMLDQLLELMR